jgi:hypothetical protein
VFTVISKKLECEFFFSVAAYFKKPHSKRLSSFDSEQVRVESEKHGTPKNNHQSMVHNMHTALTTHDTPRVMVQEYILI